MRMSQWLSAIALGTLLAAPLAHADGTVAVPSTDAGDRVTKFDNTVSLNVLGMAFHRFSANWEHRITPGGSLDVTAGFLNESVTSGSGKVTTTGMYGGLGYKLYFHPDAFDGWYFEPNASVQSISEKVTVLGAEGSGSAIAFAPGVLIGREWVWEGGFLIDFALGIDYTILNLKVKVQGTDYSAGFAGVLPDLKFALGYAF